MKGLVIVMSEFGVILVILVVFLACVALTAVNLVLNRPDRNCTRENAKNLQGMSSVDPAGYIPSRNSDFA